MTARRIGILGGTFDPIHCGHVDSAHAAQQALDLALVEVITANEPPHERPSASGHLRDGGAGGGEPKRMASPDVELLHRTSHISHAPRPMIAAPPNCSSWSAPMRSRRSVLARHGDSRRQLRCRGPSWPPRGRDPAPSAQLARRRAAGCGAAGADRSIILIDARPPTCHPVRSAAAWRRECFRGAATH
jgi:hypothetical protein